VDVDLTPSELELDPFRFSFQKYTAVTAAIHSNTINKKMTSIDCEAIACSAEHFLQIRSEIWNNSLHSKKNLKFAVEFPHCNLLRLSNSLKKTSRHTEGGAS
jgi:hypothetical protein